MKVILVFVIVFAGGIKTFADKGIEFSIIKNGEDMRICNSSHVTLTVVRNETVDINVIGYTLYYPECFIDNENTKILGFSDFRQNQEGTHAKVKTEDLKSGRWHCEFLILKNITKDVLERQTVEFRGDKYVRVNCSVWVDVEDPCTILVCQNTFYYILGGGLIALMVIGETIIIIYLKCKRKKSGELQHLQRSSSSVRYEGRYSVGPGQRKNIRQDEVESLYEEVDIPEPKSPPQSPMTIDIRNRPPMPLPKKMDSKDKCIQNITGDLEMEAYDYVDDTSSQNTKTINRASTFKKKPVPKVPMKPRQNLQKPSQLTNEKLLAPDHTLFMNELISKIGTDHKRNTAQQVRPIAAKATDAEADRNMKPMTHTRNLSFKLTEKTLPRIDNLGPIKENARSRTANEKLKAQNVRLITENLRPVKEKAHPITENARTRTENIRHITEKPKPKTENSRPITANTIPRTENVRPITENARPITENAVAYNARPIQELVRPHELRPLLENTRPLLARRVFQPPMMRHIERQRGNNGPLPMAVISPMKIDIRPSPIKGEEQLYNDPAPAEDWSDDEFQEEYLEPHHMYVNSVNLLNRST